MKKFFIIFFILLMAACTVLGMGLFGIVQIPGLKPMFAKKVVKKHAVEPVKPSESKVVAVTPAGADPKAAEDTQTVPFPAKPATIVDLDKGAKALARVWDEMDTDKLKDIAAKWKDADLARVLAKMDEDKVAEVLAAMPADRASKVSQVMQKQASVVPAAPES